MKAIKEHWIGIIKEYFPKEVELFLHPIQDFCLDVDWKLKNDPNRPNKRSKKLRLIISEETIEDYRDANDDAKKSYDQKLKKFVEKTMAHFEPDHDTPYGRTAPVETIHVPFGITY